MNKIESLKELICNKKFINWEKGQKYYFKCFPDSMNLEIINPSSNKPEILDNTCIVEDSDKLLMKYNSGEFEVKKFSSSNLILIQGNSEFELQLID
jgi:hypothetical protein